MSVPSSRMRQIERAANQAEARHRKIRGRKKIKGAIREMAIAQEWICPLCGGNLRDGRPVSIDHIRPKGRGGVDGRRNQQVTHTICNNRKGDSWDGISGWPPGENAEAAQGETT